MARSVRDLILRITGDPGDAKQALQDVAREVESFSRLKAEAKIDLQTRGAEAQLAQLNKRLDNLQKREASPKIDIAVAKTIGQIELVERKLEGLGRRKVEVKVDVDRGLATAGAALGAVSTAATAAGRGVGVLMTAFSSAIPVLGGVGRAFTSAASSAGALAPIFLALIPVVLVLAGAIAINLVGALGALAASFAAAAGGALAMGTALAVALGPVVLVAVAAFARLAAILKAVKESEEQAATQARRVRDAHQAQTQAAERFRTANAQLKATTVDAYRAMRDAAEDASDAIRSITDAELSRERAQLSLKQAQRDLADFRKEAGLTGDEFDGMFRKFTDVKFTPKNLTAAIRGSEAGQREGVDPLELADKILRVREAQQGVVNATDDVSDAVTRANDARAKEAEFLEKGLTAYPAYASAVVQAAAAQQALARTSERLGDARADQAKQLEKLNPLERRFAKTFEDLKVTLTRLVTPATNAVFRGVLDFLDDLEDFARRRDIQRALTNIGRALGDTFRALGRELRRGETRQAFVEIANAAARMIRAFAAPALTSFFRIVLRIGREALPFLEERLAGVVGWLRDLARQTGNADRLRDIIRDLVKHFDAWWGLARSVARVVGAFFKAAKDDGRRLAENLGKVVDHWADLLAKDPARLERFFNRAVTATENLAYQLGRIAGYIQWIVEKGSALTNALGAVITFDPYHPKSSINKFRKALGFQHGGVVPGTGAGDIMPAMLEPGEFVIRRSIASAIGMPGLHALNAGLLPAAAGGRGGFTIENQIVQLPAAPGHNQMGDVRHQAAMFAKELRRRGGPGLPGGGVP